MTASTSKASWWRSNRVITFGATWSMARLTAISRHGMNIKPSTAGKRSRPYPDQIVGLRCQTEASRTRAEQVRHATRTRQARVTCMHRGKGREGKGREQKARQVNQA